VIPGEWFSLVLHSCLPSRVSAVGYVCVCVYVCIRILCWITTAVYSPEVLHSYNPSANPPRGSRVIREPNRFWIYEKFPSRRFISVKTSRERNTVYLSGRARSAGKPRNSRDFISHRCARNRCIRYEIHLI